MTKEELNKKIKKANELKTINKKPLMILVVIRVLLIIAIIVDFILIFSQGKSNMVYFIIGLLVLFAVFYFVTKIHNKYFVIEENLESKIILYKNHLKRLTDDWKNFSDNGQKYIDKDSYYQTDLDVFGKSSLYQKYNLSQTYFGNKYFSEALKNKKFSKEDYLKRQEATNFLAENKEINENLSASFLRYKKHTNKVDTKNILNVLSFLSQEYKFNKVFGIYVVVGFVSLLVTFILTLLGIIDFYVPLAIFILNFIVNFIFGSSIKDLKENLKMFDNTVFPYKYIEEEYINHDYTSKLLQDYKSTLSESFEKTIKSLKALSAISFSTNNIIFSIIFNGICCVDFFALCFYSNWQKKYANEIPKISQTIGSIEELTSLSLIGYLYDGTLSPSMGEILSFEDLSHPLLLQDTSIPNSFTYSRFTIITGSNMSGKTTFLRTVGTNYLLANAGAPIICKNACFPHMEVFTSLRANDNMSEGISTFYAEIIRIKAIMSAIKSENKILVLVDEIFKGTNTLDRINGSIEAIKKMNKNNVFGFVSTHDYEICDLDFVDNYYFLEHYQDDKILFDYKINKGVSKTKNAIYLMKMAGII